MTAFQVDNISAILRLKSSPSHLKSTERILLPILKSVNRSKSPLTLLLLFPCPEPNSLLSTSDHTAHINVPNRGSVSHLLILTQLEKKHLTKSCVTAVFDIHTYITGYSLLLHVICSIFSRKNKVRYADTKKKCITSRKKEKKETKAIWWCQFSLCTTLWESFWALVWRSFIRNQFSSVTSGGLILYKSKLGAKMKGGNSLYRGVFLSMSQIQWTAARRIPTNEPKIFLQEMKDVSFFFSHLLYWFPPFYFTLVTSPLFLFLPLLWYTGPFLP